MNLVLNTTQKLLMSQKMLQSTMILQMSSAELAEYVSTLTEENPLLEFNSKNGAEIPIDNIRRKIEYLDSSDEQNSTYYSQEKDDEDENDMWKFRQSEEESLTEFVISQIKTLKISKRDAGICVFVAGCIDEVGYLRQSNEEIAESLGITVSEAEKAVNIIQSLEPSGIGARNLSECLLIQIKNLGINDKLIEHIIKNHLDLVGKNRLQIIAKTEKVSVDEVSKAVNIIKKLNPKPGSGFISGLSIEYIVPDAIVTGSDGKYTITLNDYFSAGVNISDFYRNIIKDDSDGEAKNFVYAKIRQAQWVVKCIAKRKETLYNIIFAIVEKQTEFFDKGEGHIKPLTLSDIAAKAGIHESTVSRTARGKYIQCRHGIYPLGYFFRQAATEVFGEGITQEKIQAMIKELIDNEDSASPLSDRKISEELSARGIEISRRTVAKYRGIMGINGISGRKC